MSSWQLLLKKISRIKQVNDLFVEVKDKEVKLNRVVGRWELMALGIGAIIGAGIFVITGTAAAGGEGHLGAGPALIISFILTAFGCFFCALCYAEFASMVPIAGSAYTYSYISMGEILAWIIGWDLLLEYTFDAATVAIGWSGYMHQLLEKVFHIDFPDYLTVPTLKAINHSADYVHFPHIFGLPVSVNLPAMLIIALLTMLLIKGISESTKVNNVIVALKLVIVLIFIFVGAFFVERSNWIPFAPNGWPGIFAGASLVFFAYIGFDALTTASEEVKNPGKDLPFAIIGSLLVCTVLYIIVTAILTGMIKYTQLNVPDPVAVALNFVGLKWAPANWLANYIVSVGAVIALTSTMLVFLMGQPRILFAMGRDGFLPPIFAKVHPKFHTPYIPTIISGTIVMLLAGFGDLDSVASLCNIGTLTAFIMVAVGIIILRKKCPESPRKFKVPYVPLFPILGILVCLILIAYLPKVAIIGFFVWMIIGLIIYFNYGIKHTYYKTSEDAVVCNIEEFNDDGIVK